MDGVAMGREIERKFLVQDQQWRQLVLHRSFLRQGYLSVDPQRTVRVRLDGEKAFLTIKGVTSGASRAEYEYPLPAAEARELLDELCLRPLIEKTRFRLHHGGLLWEIDEFHGDNQGLVVAEVELQREDQPLVLPEWVGEEVTGDRRYHNSNLLAHPYRNWKVISV
jgi:adenylate cyclase